MHTQMDLEIVVPSEARKRKTHLIQYCLHVQLKKNGTNQFIHKKEIVTDVENKLMGTRVKGERDKLGDWDWHIYTNIYKTGN